MNFDFYLFNLIHGLAGRYKWLDYAGIFFAKYFEYVLLFVLFLFLILQFKKKYKIFLLAFASAVVSRFVLAELIRFFWFRPRPFVVFNFVPLIQQSPVEASFPSGHASFYFALATIIYLYNKKAGIVFYAGAVLIALARVFVGVHWPSDILVGAILGILVAIILNKIFVPREGIEPS